MITASELGLLEGKRAVQISYNGDGILEIVFEDVFDEYGNEVDRTLQICGTSYDGMEPSLDLVIW